MSNPTKAKLNVGFSEWICKLINIVRIIAVALQMCILQHNNTLSTGWASLDISINQQMECIQRRKFNGVWIVHLFAITICEPGRCMQE